MLLSAARDPIDCLFSVAIHDHGFLPNKLVFIILLSKSTMIIPWTVSDSIRTVVAPFAFFSSMPLMSSSNEHVTCFAGLFQPSTLILLKLQVL